MPRGGSRARLASWQKPRHGWKDKRHGGVPPLTGASKPAVPSVPEADMSDRRNCSVQVRSFDAGSFARCPRCQGWFDRSDPLALAEHRGPLPHPVPNPRTAWADEDDEAF
jgi:Zn-finger nucleic acid-binding protein